jgi:hypothetical protein
MPGECGAAGVATQACRVDAAAAAGGSVSEYRAFRLAGLSAGLRQGMRLFQAGRHGVLSQILQGVREGEQAGVLGLLARADGLLPGRRSGGRLFHLLRLRFPRRGRYGFLRLWLRFGNKPLRLWGWWNRFLYQNQRGHARWWRRFCVALDFRQRQVWYDHSRQQEDHQGHVEYAPEAAFIIRQR